MTQFEKTLNLFDYQFPAELIAQSPANPRDSARLLIYDRRTNTTAHDTYTNILQYLPKNAVLVLNQTKVVPARFSVTKPTGGKAKLLYIKHDTKHIFALSDKKLELNSIVRINKLISFTVIEKTQQGYTLLPSFPIKHVFQVLDKHGQTPLPPYIKHSPLKGKRLLNEYNTVFAKDTGSVAAPTASLHFTTKLLADIQKTGIAIKYVTLHVNLGTFASLTPEQLKNKKLHLEEFHIAPSTARFLNNAKKKGRPIIAVGTTAVRTLESASTDQGQLTTLNGMTDLFITEKTKLKFVDALITNFHVPQSSLLMLVSAFIGRTKLLELYKLAISKKYRLFSFGDGMYITPTTVDSSTKPL